MALESGGMVLTVVFGVQVRMMSADLKQELSNTTLGLPKDSEVIFADLARADSGGQCSYLAVVLTRGADGSTNACRWRVNGTHSSSSSMTKAKWDPLQHPGGGADRGKGASAGGASVLTCALHKPPSNSTTQPTLSVVWDTFVWQRFRVGAGSSPAIEASFHVSGVGVAPAPRRAPTSRSKGSTAPSSTGVVAATVDSDYLLMIGRDEADESSKSVNCLTAWDSVYGTKQGAGHLRWSADEPDVAHYSADAATAARSSHDGLLVAVALDKCVVVCAVQSSAMSLDMVVASAASVREKSRPQPSAAMRPVDVLACITMAGDGRVHEREGAAGEAVATEGPRTRLAQAVQEGNRREGAILSQINSEVKGDKWVEAVKLYLEDLHAESVNTEAARRAPKASAGGGGGRRRSGGGGGAGTGNCSASGRAGLRVVVSEEVVDAVMRRCTRKGADGKFDEALLALVQAGAVTACAQPTLLPYAIEVRLNAPSQGVPVVCLVVALKLGWPLVCLFCFFCVLHTSVSSVSSL